MNINDYITQHRMQPFNTESSIRPGFVPASLAAKFSTGETVEYYSDPKQSRWVGISRAHNFFAAANPGVAVTTGTLKQEYPTLRSF